MQVSLILCLILQNHLEEEGRGILRVDFDPRLRLLGQRALHPGEAVLDRLRRLLHELRWDAHQVRLNWMY